MIKYKYFLDFPRSALLSLPKIQLVFKVIHSFNPSSCGCLKWSSMNSAVEELNIKVDDILETGDYFRGALKLSTSSVQGQIKHAGRQSHWFLLLNVSISNRVSLVRTMTDYRSVELRLIIKTSDL